MRRTALPITGWAAVNALGRSTDEVLKSLDAGETGLRPPPFALPFPTMVGAVADPLPALPRRYQRYDCRLARLGVMAYSELAHCVAHAVERWGRRRVAILIGTSTGGLDATEVAYRHALVEGQVPDSYSLRHQHDFNALGELLAEMSGIEGPVYVVSTACSSSGKVHASAARLIAAGLVDAALVGGIDSLCRMTLFGFRGLGILSEERCRPFSVDRTGINIGEGAAWMLIERDTRHRRSAHEPIWLLGCGESSDAYNMSSPEPTGRGAREAMERAMAQGGLAPDGIGLINAHATATMQNDAAESAAIRDLFGDRTPVISTKGYTGHLLGAAGATEAVFALHAVRTGRIPPSLGSDAFDPQLGIRIIREATKAPLDAVLSSSFAFGGSNVCLAIGKRGA